MVTVLDAGIQDALNRVLVQTSGLEPNSQGIGIRAHTKQRNIERRERKFLKLLHITVLASVVAAKVEGRLFVALCSS